MKTVTPVNGNGLSLLKGLYTDNAFGHSFIAWIRLQTDKNGRDGQAMIRRFNRYKKEVPELWGRMRKQNGHQHRCSVGFLFTEMMLRIKPYVNLDELLLTRCINHHDEPEGILEVDVPATSKTATDDLIEYTVFEELYKPLGSDVWPSMQKAFLLQFCLDNPGCFPSDARSVMSWLARDNRKEALFFQGVQKLDYLYYAYEQAFTRGLQKIQDDVAGNQMRDLDYICKQLPGFKEVVWTPEKRDFFAGTLKPK